jgi:hypothetical protein
MWGGEKFLLSSYLRCDRNSGVECVSQSHSAGAPFTLFQSSRRIWRCCGSKLERRFTSQHMEVIVRRRTGVPLWAQRKQGRPRPTFAYTRWPPSGDKATMAKASGTNCESGPSPIVRRSTGFGAGTVAGRNCQTAKPASRAPVTPAANVQRQREGAGVAACTTTVCRGR